MGEQLRVLLANTCQPGPCLLWLVPEPLELVHSPSDQVLVDALCEGVQFGAVEGSVITDPASHLGVDVPSEVGQVLVAAAFEVPRSEIFWPTAFFALALMAGEKLTKKPLGPLARRPRKV